MSKAQEEKRKKRVVIILLLFVALLTGASGFLAKKVFVDNANEIDTITRGKRSAEDRFAKLSGDIEKAEALLSSIGITDLDSNSVLSGEVEAIKALREEKRDKISKLKSQIEELISA